MPAPTEEPTEPLRLAWALRGLLLAVARLALPPDEQRAYLRRSGVGGSADELALEFDDAVHLLDQLAEAGWVEPERAAALRRLDDMLAAMSGAANAALWEPEALASAPQWAQARRTATDLLLDW